MSVLTKVGYFDVAAGTGSRTVEVGFRPKLVFFTCVQYATDNVWLVPGVGGDGAGGVIGGGVMDDSGGQYAWTLRTRKDIGIVNIRFTDMTGGSSGSNCFLVLSDVAGTFSSVSDTEFTVNYTSSGGARRVNYYAIGGSDIEQTAVFGSSSYTDRSDPPMNGSFTYDINIGFEPNFLMTMGHVGNAEIYHGFTTACGMEQVGMHWGGQHGDTDDNANSTTLSATWPIKVRNGLTRIQTFLPTGYRIYNDQAGNDNHSLHGIAIKGGSHRVLTHQISANGTVTVPTGLVGPRGVMAYGGPWTAFDTNPGGSTVSMGFSDGTSQRMILLGHDNGGETDVFMSGNYLTTNPDSAGDTNYNTTSVQSFAGGVQLNQTNQSGRRIGLWVIGDGDVGHPCGYAPRASFDGAYVF